jgi:hypothetical protein
MCEEIFNSDGERKMLADVQFPAAFQNFHNFIYSCSTSRPNSYRTVFDPIVLMT